jgi:cell division protein FtsB
MRIKDRRQLDGKLQTASALNAAKVGAIIDDVKLGVDAQLAVSDLKLKEAAATIIAAQASITATMTEIAALKAKVTALEAKVK